MANNVDASQVLAALANLPELLEKNMTDVLTNACLAVQHEAQHNCPVGDGTLRRSITTQVTKEDGKLVGYVGSNLFYAPFIHQGTGIFSPLGRKQVPWKYKDLEGNWHTTKGMQATPFLQKAVDSKRHDILTYFKGVLSDDN